MQVSARQDILFSSSFDRFRFVCLADMPLTIYHVCLCSTISRPIDGLMSLSFWIDFWCMGHDGFRRWVIYPPGSACGFSGEHASVLTTTDKSMVPRQTIQNPLRCATVAVSVGLPDYSAAYPTFPSPSSNQDNLASQDR